MHAAKLANDHKQNTLTRARSYVNAQANLTLAKAAPEHSDMVHLELRDTTELQEAVAAARAAEITRVAARDAANDAADLRLQEALKREEEARHPRPHPR